MCPWYGGLQLDKYLLSGIPQRMWLSTQEALHLTKITYGGDAALRV
jgi:hypothetical protein